MTLESFFDKCDPFADAVAKMRELVLQLAVQGRLVDQQRSDGDALSCLPPSLASGNMRLTGTDPFHTWNDYEEITRRFPVGSSLPGTFPGMVSGRARREWTRG